MRGVIIILCLLGFSCLAQEKINIEKLQQIAEEYKLKYKNAKLLAKKEEKNKMPSNQLYVGIIDGMPIYLSTNDANQNKATNADYLHNNTIPNVNVTGKGLTIYMWDGGRVRSTHQEFSNRVTNLEPNTVNTSTHSTGVAGVIIGRGVNTNAKGAAYEANLNSYDFNNNLTEIATESANTNNGDYLISNHSYNIAVGWRYDEQNNDWYWHGYPSVSETDPIYYGFYSTGDSSWDDILYNAPQHIAIKAAGNDKGLGPEPGTPHYAYNNSSEWVYVENTTRPKNCEINGYDCIPSYGVAKNTITVGAINPITSNNGRYTQPSDITIASFSSVGPTDDGRIKPDLVSIGNNVTAPTSSSNSDYFTEWKGSSFSTPSVTGIIALLQQIYNESTNNYLRSDLAKALLIHTANEAGEAPGPDYEMGWGLVNALSAAEVIVGSDDVRVMQNHTLNNNEEFSIDLTSNGTEPLKATIVWLDPPGEATPLNGQNLNNRTPKLVNDLDLRIINDETEHLPWRLDVENPANPATKGDNIVDNVEQVLLESPLANQVYTIKVTHKGSTLTNDSQNFALIVTGIKKDNMTVVDNNLNQSIVIYPNPVQDEVNLKTDVILTNVKVKVLNINGQVILESDYKALNDSNLFNLNRYPAGEYLIYITSDQGKYSKLLIKK